MKTLKAAAALAALALAYPATAEEAGSATRNFFPNPSFEEWAEGAPWPEAHGGAWRLQREQDEYGRPLFAGIGPTNGLAHSGNVSLHVVDSHGGAYDNVIYCRLPRGTEKAFAGKGLKLTAWALLLDKNVQGSAGIGAMADCRESPTAHAAADFPVNDKRSDGWTELTCFLKVPEDIQGLTIVFRCAKGFFGRCEICYDDIELTVIPPEQVPETAEERERRLRKPFVPNTEAAEWAATWLDDGPFTDDGFVRPAIRGGNFVWPDGRHFFPVGPWFHPRTQRDWNEKAIARHGIDHPAYTCPPGKRAFEYVGCTAAHMSSAPSEIGAALAGYSKDTSKTKASVAGYRDEWKHMDDFYLSIDFAFGYKDSVRARNPDLEERIRQRRAGWCSFVPFCPESPEGMAYYRNYISSGARLALGCGLNVGVWELFNESAYGCECEYNKRAFAAEAERRYGSIAAANAAWGTSFADFGAVAKARDMGRFKGLWNEWCEFLAGRYADLLRELSAMLRSIDRRPNVYFTEQLWIYQIWDGMTDYRRIADALDLLAIEGGWNYGRGAEPKAKDEMEAVVFAGSLHWYVLDFFHALTRGGKPVVNNELYCSRAVDGRRIPSRAEDLVTSLWMEFFHGISGSHMYIWEKRADEWTTFEQAKANVISPSYKSNALLNPYNWPPDQLDAFARFRKEFERWQDRISEFPRTAEPSIGIYHSQVSAAMAKYGREIKMPMVRAHSSLLHAFYPVTFVFDHELVGGAMPKSVKTIVVPAADFERDEVREALERFVANGGHAVIDEKAFSFDEHGRKAGRGVAGALTYDASKTTGDGLLDCIGRIGVPKIAEVEPLDGKGPLPGADVQVIDRGDFKLVLIVNLVAADAPRRVRLSLPAIEAGDGWRVLDGVTGEPVPGDPGAGIELTLPPQERVLLEIGRGGTP